MVWHKLPKKGNKTVMPIETKGFCADKSNGKKGRMIQRC